MAFPTTPTNGQQATVNGITYTYSSATNSWTRLQKTLPSLSINVDTFVSDGSTTSYTLAVTPSSKELITVNIDGVLQQKTAYNLSSNVISFTGTPKTGAVIEVKTINASPSSIVTGLVFDSYTGDGLTLDYTLSSEPTNKNYTLVTIGGVTQHKTTYNVSSNVLTFSSVPPNGSSIEIITFGPAVSSLLAGGSNNQVQINNSGSLIGYNSLTFNNVSNTLSTTNLNVSGNITVTGNTTLGDVVSNTINTGNINVTGTIVGNISSSQPNITSLGTLSSLTVSGVTTLTLAADVLVTIAGATGVVTHDLTNSGVFNHVTPAANFTANFTNLPVTNDRILATTILVNQGATPYLPTAVQIEGAAQTIKWVTGAVPSGNANKIDAVSFSFIRTSNSWTVMGQGTYFG